MDPVEKKPLYHFHPGKPILSTGPRGCNLSCKHCQNWSISQADGPTNHQTPEDLIELAESKGSMGLAYTYTEPSIAFEFVLDCARKAADRGLKNVMVTNGFINPDPLADLIEVIGAFNVDLKAMDDDFYREVCGGRLQPVLDSIRDIANSPAHLEITNLIIPGYNDSEDMVREMVDFIASLSPAIPLHLSGYHPAYKLDAPPTSIETLKRAFDIASDKLHYVFAGNRRTSWGNDTLCPKCGNKLVGRGLFRSHITGITDDGRCDNCGRAVDVVGEWSRS